MALELAGHNVTAASHFVSRLPICHYTSDSNVMGDGVSFHPVASPAEMLYRPSRLLTLIKPTSQGAHKNLHTSLASF